MTFDFFHVPRICFGPGQLERLGELARSLGSSVLLVHNGPREQAERARSLLTQSSVAVETHRQKGEPTVADVDAALAIARAQACDAVVGLGGGSAIDAAKAVAGLLTNGGSALDYMEVVGKGMKITRAAAPWIAIPTTAGAGAEVTRNAVIGAPEHRFKASIRGEQLMARVALVDPLLQTSTPPDVTASSGMDALCQCIEAFTSTGAGPITDAIALKAITLCAQSLETAFRDGKDLAARENMSLAALLGGIALTNAGLGAVHGFAAPLGANITVPHGTACAALLAPVMAANLAQARSADPAAPLVRRYAQIGRVLGADLACPDAEAADQAVARAAELAARLQIPPLGKFGLARDDVPRLVLLARKSSSMRFNPVILSDAELSRILLSAI